MKIMINNILNKPFPYLNKTSRRIIHVIIIFIYSIAFLKVFKPFNAQEWLNEGWIAWFGIAGFGLLGSIVIGISQLVIRSMVKFDIFKVKHFILWFIAELLFITLFMSWIYGNPENTFFTELKATFKYTSLISVLPYSFSILLIVSIVHHNEKTDNSKIVKIPNELISFKDERDQIKFSIKRKDLLYLESTDNYITVYFINETLMSKQMVRTSLKKIEESKICDNLARCHRSFMVNIENVLWIKKEGRNYVLKVKNTESLIPVSKSYVPRVKSILS